MISSINDAQDRDGDDDTPLPRTELDSHANMVVLGANAFIFDRVQDRRCDVSPFDPSLGKATSVPIVDGAIAYDCPYSNETFILIFYNALYFPSLNHNLVPPFIMREAGLQVNDIAKIHVDDPTKKDHAIVIEDLDLSIPMQLNGIFSFFPFEKAIQT